MIHIRDYDKNNAYTINILHILYNTIGNIIIIMVIGRWHNSNMTADKHKYTNNKEIIIIYIIEKVQYK